MCVKPAKLLLKTKGKPVKILQLDHVALHVKDVQATSEFYQKVLGLKRMDRPNFSFNGAWLKLGEKQSLHLIEGLERDVINSNRGDHFALLVDDIEAWAEHLVSLGVSHRGPKTRADGAFQIFIDDPDAHSVELSTLP